MVFRTRYRERGHRTAHLGRSPSFQVWVVIAKLLGLYDRDERPLRHTTIDEAESLVLWAVSGTFALVPLSAADPGWIA